MSENSNKPSWADFGRTDLLPAGHALGEVSLLFEKIEDEAIEAQIQKLQKTKQENSKTNSKATEAKPEISFEDFAKMDIRTCKILKAEKVEKTDKLLKFEIDTGVDVRTVVSGIAQSFSPEELVGKQVLILLNLAPRKIRGIESHGMLLLTEKPDRKYIFVIPESDTENGKEVG